MRRPTSTPLPDERYIDAHGKHVTVISVEFNRVIFQRDGYEFPSVQPIERFTKEFTLLFGGNHA